LGVFDQFLFFVLLHALKHFSKLNKNWQILDFIAKYFSKDLDQKRDSLKLIATPKIITRCDFGCLELNI